MHTDILSEIYMHQIVCPLCKLKSNGAWIDLHLGVWEEVFQSMEPLRFLSSNSTILTLSNKIRYVNSFVATWFFAKLEIYLLSPKLSEYFWDSYVHLMLIFCANAGRENILAGDKNFKDEED